MKLFDIDFESFRLESFETEKSQIFEELKQLAQLYYLGIEKRRYELYEKSLELVTKKEYASGGYSVFRGYYCPFLYKTFAVGGCNRGTLLKRVTKKSKISYEYGYEKDQLILVKEFEDDTPEKPARKECVSAEFIERRGDIEIGVQVPLHRGNMDEVYESIELFTVCQYMGEQAYCKRQILCHEDRPGLKIDTIKRRVDYRKEWVTYQNGKPKKIDYFSHYLMWNEVNSITLCFDEHGIPVQYYHGDEKDRLYDVTKVNRKYYAQQYGMNGL